MRQNTNRHVNYEFIANYYFESFRVDPTFSIDNIRARVKRDFGVDVQRTKAWRGRERAVKLIHGDDTSQYAKLNSYALELKKSNPGTTVKLDLEQQVFKAMYVCVGPLKEGFKY